MSQPVIGFIGVGFMGAGMAKNLVTKGYPLVIMGNKNREPVERLKALVPPKPVLPKRWQSSATLFTCA